MQARMACTLSVVLAWACAPSPAAAQVKPAKAQSSQSLPERTPPARKSSESLKRTEKDNDLHLYNLLRDAQENTLELRKLPSFAQSDVAGGPPLSCAHILIYEAPPTDSRMIIEVPKDSAEPATTYPGLPPCNGDFRPRFFITQVPTPQFMKPARTDSPRPGSEKRSSSVRPE
jgi:hypothetical protein